MKLYLRDTLFNVTNRNSWLVFGLFVIAVLSKNVLFQQYVFDELYINNPTEAFKFYGATIAVALLLGSPIVITKNRWWTVVLMLIMDVWYMALMIYYMAWGVFMNISVIQMADNMDGFWGSVWTYMHWKTIIPLVITAIYAIILYFLPKGEKRNWWAFVLVVCMAYAYVPLRQYPTWKRNIEELHTINLYTNKLMHTIWNYSQLFKPYRSVRAKAYVAYMAGGKGGWEETYIKEQGYCDYGIAMIIFQTTYDYYVHKYDESAINSELTDEEKQIVSTLIDDNSANFIPQRSLIFLLVESLESWTIDYKTDNGYIMPNMRQFMQLQPTFYADKLTSQAAFGGSGDGQMIAMTGMIPLQSGAACRLYGDITYPNIAQFYPHSVTLNSSPGAWNQPVVNPSYGLKELDESIHQDDRSIIDSLIVRLKKETEPTFYLVITVSSHTPFKKAGEVDWAVDKAMPNNMASYIKCIHYFDEQFGRLVDELKTMNKLNDVDIIITGDHIIFSKMMLSELIEYAEAQGLSFYEGKNYCPLIISSPNIKDNIRYSEVGYQMDIFPTVKHVVGADDYWWKGFGINMLADTIRPYDIETLKTLSDKMIRSDYFVTKKL